MKYLLAAVLMTVRCIASPAIEAFWATDLRDEKTGEQMTAFYLAPLDVKAVYEAMARQDEKAASELGAKLPKDAWSYIVILTGEKDPFGLDRILIREGTICGDYPRLVSGTITLDRVTGKVRVALKVELDGKVGDFKGNGVHPLNRQPPPKPPEPPSARKS